MTLYEIPLTPQPQSFSIVLGLLQYRFVVRWNWVAQIWTLDIYNVDNSPLVLGIFLTTGADLLGQYSYLNFGGKLAALSDFDFTKPPSFTNLGINGKLYFLTS